MVYQVSIVDWHCDKIQTGLTVTIQIFLEVVSVKKDRDFLY